FQPDTADTPAEAAQTPARQEAVAAGAVTAAASVLTASAVGVTDRLEPTDLRVEAGQKRLITGAHGAGRSSLLRRRAGCLPPTTGRIDRDASQRVGLLTQEISLPDPADRGPDRTVAQAYTDLVGLERAEEVPIQTFGLLAGRDLNRPVRTLSVDRKSVV